MIEDRLLGLRDEDLTTEERLRRDAALASDAGLRQQQADALALGAALRSLPPPRRAVPATRVPWVAGGVGALLVAVAVMVMLRVPSDAGGLHARGGGAGAPSVIVRALADGADGPRPVVPGGNLAVGTPLVLEAETSGAGTLAIDEVGATTTRIWPTEGQWSVGAGRHHVGGDRLLAWTPSIAGEQRYVATFCPDGGGDCVAADLVVRWTAP